MEQVNKRVNMYVFRCLLCNEEWQEVPTVQVIHFSERAAMAIKDVKRSHRCITTGGQQIGVAVYVGMREVSV